MKGSNSERNESAGGSPSDEAASHGQIVRETLLGEIFELQLGMLWLAQQAMRGILTRFALHPPHLMALHLLGGNHPRLAVPNQGGLSMRDFIRSMDLPPASATAMIDHLTTQDLVERGANEQDRRVVMVRLTSRGCEVLAQITDCWQQVQRDAFTVLTDEQLTGHLALMRRVQQGYLQRFPEAAGHSGTDQPSVQSDPRTGQDEP